ncbi:MAG: AAA family ATPase, partial [Deltaproteobacteria bacterium]|nr:AAA family ATPase [Deltaproteobacteria bacterium]
LSLDENVALIIDEAQNLPSTVLEELRMLSNLETPREKLLQILLVGQPELDFKLRSPKLRQLKQRIGINCYLAPLNNEERIKYVQHRLTVAGCNDGHIFSHKALELLCNHSGGIPRIINILCDNALLSAYGKDQKRIDTGIIEDVISDYESSMPPTSEKDKVITTVDERKKISIKASLSIVFLLAIIAFLIIVISAYRNNHIHLDQIMHNVSTIISTTWQKIDRPTMDSTRKDNHQKPHTEDSIREANNHNGGMTLQNEIISKSNPTIKEPAFPKRMSLPLEDHSMPTDSSSIGKNYKMVFAKAGDMISSLVLREYGILNDTIFDVVKRANPDIEDLDKISIGQKIVLPNLGINSRIVEVGKGVFSIHIASFSSYDDAKQYFGKSGFEKLPISISPVKIAGRRLWYRVTLGNFTSREQAIAYAKN